jgi:hypothetical protein
MNIDTSGSDGENARLGYGYSADVRDMYLLFHFTVLQSLECSVSFSAMQRTGG